MRSNGGASVTSDVTVKVLDEKAALIIFYSRDDNELFVTG